MNRSFRVPLKESYLLIIIIVGILSLCMYSSFALFSLEKTTSKDIFTMRAASNIETTLKIFEYKKITVPAGSNTSVMVNVNNDTGGSIYYGVFYEMVSPSTKTDDIGIYKIDWSANATSGSITNGSILPVELLVINNTSSDITLNIGVAGSDSNELGLTDGKTLITETFNTGEEVTGGGATSTTDFSYTGAVQTKTLTAGSYKLEVWGAQGGNYSTSALGGKGGYSYGNITLTSDTNVYVYVGGQPATNTSDRVTVSGGFNGGGAGYNRYYSGTYTYGQGGGGASDIRINEDSLYSRVIVAGGGGGAASEDGTAKYGGGTSGGSAQSGYGGSQTSAGTNGSFGTGGSATTSGNNYKYGSGGGGGGWYGGGASSSYSDSTNYRSYNGGGSGYVYTSSTASNYPSGVKLTSTYYLTNAATIAGNTSFTDNDGTTVTGHSGNGHARISNLDSRPSIDTSAITVSEGDNIDLKSQVTCNDNGSGCKIVLVKPATTVGITETTIALYILEDNNGNRYKYKKTINLKQNAVKLIMSQSKGNEWSANAEDGLYATNSYTTSDGTNKYHDYRYVGADPNNYVWFNNDMYQIIGVFDENSHGKSGQYLVKLIMANTLGGYSWGAYNSSNTSGTYSDYKNDWTGATTGIKANLNILFNEYFLNGTNTNSTYGACSNWTYVSSNINYRTNDCSDIVGYGIDSSALNSIETTTWYLYGSGTAQSKQNWYLCERGGSSCISANSGTYSSTTDAKIGLMYVSDYLYASSYYASSDITDNENPYFGNKNWLYNGDEWTLTPFSDELNYVKSISSGSVYASETFVPNYVRPSFYLKSNVSISSGDGTFANPYIIE